MAVLNTLKYQKKNITIKNTTHQCLPLSQRRLKGIAHTVLENLGILDEWSLGITFMDDTQIRMLNKKYLARDKATDVLAFNYSGNTADIAISIETAKQNAALYKNTCKNEIILYIIHGLLHIFGYDDTTLQKAKRMCKKQGEIFLTINKKGRGR